MTNTDTSNNKEHFRVMDYNHNVFYTSDPKEINLDTSLMISLPVGASLQDLYSLVKKTTK